jgi:peptidoglycan pentaglycine glycine transferase (the first glycine)
VEQTSAKRSLPTDAEWDAILAASPNGHYEQSSMWARLMARDGWAATRIAIGGGEPLVSGQLLTKSLPVIGTIGYMPKGPLLRRADPELALRFVDGLLAHVQTHRVRYLAIAPVRPDEAFEGALSERAFTPNAVASYRATVRLDVTRSLDDLLSGMSKWTRRNIRRGQTHGVAVREGDESDLDTFSRLKLSGRARKNNRYAIRPHAYYADMWRIFRPGGHIQLLVAEYGGEPVSAMLAIAFGDTVFAHSTAWSGVHGAHKPNEVLEWEAIKWAKQHGYHFFDFEGIQRHVADSIANGMPLKDEIPKVAKFKLGFGGQIVLLPGAYDYVPNALLGWGIRRLYPVLRNTRAKTVRNRLTGRTIQSRSPVGASSRRAA